MVESFWIKSTLLKYLFLFPIKNLKISTNYLPLTDCCHAKVEQSKAKLFPLPVGLSNKQCCLLFNPLTIYGHKNNKKKINKQFTSLGSLSIRYKYNNNEK